MCAKLGAHLAALRDLNTYNYICSYIHTLTNEKVRIDGTIQADNINTIKLHDGKIIDVSTYPKANDWRYTSTALSIGINPSGELENCVDADEYSYPYICEWDYDVRKTT